MLRSEAEWEEWLHDRREDVLPMAPLENPLPAWMVESDQRLAAERRRREEVHALLTGKAVPRSTASKIAMAERLRANQTEAERALGAQLQRIPGLSFEAQVLVDGWIADFMCWQLGLVIEVDGSAHDSMWEGEYDRFRQRALEEAGRTVLRVRNEDVFGGTAIRRIGKAIAKLRNGR